MSREDPSPAEALAEGFAAHARQWAQSLGALPATWQGLEHAARETSRATSEGHVCASLDDIAAALGEPPAALAAALFDSGVVGRADDPGTCPLVLDAGGRLYLRRYFEDERRLARRLVQASRAGADGLSIVSGGPGTGKTTRIVRELGRMLQADPALRIALAAPTGKAAARMSEAIRARAQADVPPGVRDLLPTEAATLHRLLRLRPGAGFEHGPGNPLPIDVLVVDEASMLDLSLATRLLEAVPPGARIVLLGDKDQLSAVETGAVFAEISSDPDLLPVTWLTTSHRFPEHSAIGRFAAAVRSGDAGHALAWLGANTDPQLAWQATGSALDIARRGYQPFLDALARDPGDVQAVAAAFNRFRVLCAVREGPQGVESLNRQLAEPARAVLPDAGRGEWYAGRPVMVVVNDYAMKLFNGDIGITLPGPDGQLMVHFAEAGGWRRVPPARVPRHETAFALTVHKSQGSEFDEVLLVLPAQESRVVTRELVYTGVTRARERVVVHASAPALGAALAAAAVRRSGLRERIREAMSGPLPAAA